VWTGQFGKGGPTRRAGTVPAVPEPPSADATADRLARVWLFAECSPAELELVGRAAVPRHAAAGDVLVREGELGDELFVIVDGRVAVTLATAPIAELGPNDFFGEMALVDGGERTATVQALTDLDLLVVSRDAFNDLLATAMASVAPKLLQVIGERMRDLAARSGSTPGWA
jgi:voltage-gated potassium channel